jgi:hypothetical protein
MKPVEERKVSGVSVTFRDRTGTLVIPTSVISVIEDVYSGTLIREEYTETPSTSTHIFKISSYENRILGPTRVYEYKCLNIKYLYGTSDTGYASYVWKVRNLCRVPLPNLVGSLGASATLAGVMV